MTRSPPAGSVVEKPPAVVIGLDSMQGLQAARILHGHGVPVLGVARNPQHHACSTNTCRSISYTETGSDELLDTLRELGRSLEQPGVLVPCQDKSVLIVSRHRKALEKDFHIVLPPHDVVEMLMEKTRFYTYAREHGVAIPQTVYLYSRAEAVEASRQMSFPCLLKPARRTKTWDEHTLSKVFKVETAREFLDRYDQVHTWADGLVAQQWIEGDDSSLYSCNFYYGKAGEPLVTFVARKLRQWPPEAGSSCLGEEVRDQRVLDATLEMFGALSYRGLGYLEMKRDARTGEYFVIEPNIGRPTGRSAIAEGGGVELLYTAYCDALDLPLPPEREQNYKGTKWIDLRHDFQSAFLYWRRGQLSLLDWIRSLRGPKTYAVFSWRDPAPFARDLKNALTVAVKKLGRVGGSWLRRRSVR